MTRILIVLPYLFSVRDFLFSRVCDLVEQEGDLEITILGNASLRTIIREKDLKSFKVMELGALDPLKAKSGLRGWLRWQYNFLDKYLFDAVKLRWGFVNDLNFVNVFSGKSRKEQKKYEQFFDFRKGVGPSRPFPRNRKLYEALLYIRDKCLFRHVDPAHVGLLKDCDFDFVLLGRFEMPIRVFYWLRLFQTANLPVYSIVGSWDHPTTKGPPSPLIRKFVVASRAMTEQMGKYSGIDESRIEQIGKVQMDMYAEADSPKAIELLKQSGFDDWDNYILFCPNTTGLKEHEVSIAAYLARKVEQKELGSRLLIRCHPQDKNWKRDFLPLDNGDSVRVIQASGFDPARDDLSKSQDDPLLLAALIRHSGVVVQSRGSIALDAIAQDKPVISINFDGDLELECDADTFALENTYHHYAPLVEAGGVEIVSSYEELIESIATFIETPHRGSEGRKRVLEDHLAPLDGRAAERLVECLQQFGRESVADSED